jgi:hypothetical protein
MPAFRTGFVTEIVSERKGLQRILVDEEPAYVLTQLVGPVAVGDEVVLNTTAVDLGLGTGGWHVVHWNLSRGAWSEPGPGHIMKLRYTSLQVDTGAAEEDGALADVPASLDGTPVVACTLHSQVACVATAFKHVRRDGRVVYVMTDGAALPIALSDLVEHMREAGVIDATITAGHAFGGDLEAVSVPSALCLARHALAADLVVVAMGPGVVGTGSALGTTAVDAASALDAAAVLGGHPLLALRVSELDPRERHRGVSHHSTTVLRMARPGVTVPVPSGFGLDVDAPGHWVEPTDTPPIAELLAHRRLRVTTMGRTPDDDPVFFAAAAAAGVAAARRTRQ